MRPRVLFIITSDPRRSGKPAEAIRIAAGVSAWKKTDISVYLRDDAVRALDEDTADLINEDNFTRYLPMLAENKCAIYVQQSDRASGESALRPEQLNDTDLAKLAAQQTYVLRF
jgi:sulfur relay (sulfurtransferase) DsrF/TusC family protein